MHTTTQTSVSEGDAALVAALAEVTPADLLAVLRRTRSDLEVVRFVQELRRVRWERLTEAALGRMRAASKRPEGETREAFLKRMAEFDAAQAELNRLSQAEVGVSV